MNEIVLQTKVLTKEEMPISAQQIADRLLETYSGVEAYVIAKSTAETILQAMELMKEKAITAVNGSKEVILGAEVALKMSPRKYEYSGTEYKRLEKEVDTAVKNLKSHKSILELSPNGWINPSTGETETATLVSGGGTTINVTFQGTNKPK